ncbi:hypothetical protein [uncultured Gimesia sp.]|uniref:hypothetical protein n=1 Tax=uncultured Gimesia sp. TaxID=1678688 RepID=UPI0026321437|nr:hypothetical protein [uncultured Gimesia sp.]
MALEELISNLRESSASLFFALVIFFLIPTAIGALILRKAVSMFNKGVYAEEQDVRMPSLFKAMGILFIATFICYIVWFISGYVSQSYFLLSPEELRSGYILLLMIPPVVIGFFAYSGVVCWLMSVTYGTGMLIVLNDYIVRFVILLILGGISFVLDGIRLSLS